MEKNNKEIYIGQYGRMRELFLKYNAPKTYREMKKSKELIPYLQHINKIAAEMEEDLAQRMARAEGLTDEVKETDPQEWIGLMNNYRMCAREIVIKDIIEV